MKKFKVFILPVIALFLSANNLFAKESHVESRRIPNFYITKRTIDTTMKEGQSLFIFTFYGDGGLMKKKTIRFGRNEEEFNFTTDTTGRKFLTNKPGKFKLYFYYDKSLDEVISDSVKIRENEIIEVRVSFSNVNRPMNVKKPVIYVYPEKEMEVNIQLNVTGQLRFTYPFYDGGWNFTASPNGDITIDEKKYNYLFWESDMTANEIDRQSNSGFLVKTDTLLSFLENNLSQMGLNSKESADFITFWYPQMIKNESNHIHFLFNESCDTYAELNITPKPQNIFRVGMLWAEAKNNFIPQPPTIPVFNREGFSVLEWGGIEMPDLFELQEK